MKFWKYSANVNLTRFQHQRFHLRWETHLLVHLVPHYQSRIASCSGYDSVLPSLVYILPIYGISPCFP